MTSERVRIRVPFRATVIPRGGRIPREVVYADELVPDIRVLPALDLPVAMRLRQGGDPNRIQRLDYFGFDGDLWIPMDADERDGSRLTPERVIAAIAAGEEYVGQNLNPFLELSARPVKPAQAAGAGRIEEAAPRSVLSNDRARSLGRAARVADDLIFTDDGQVLRRSPGVFHCFGPGGAALLPCRHELPDIAGFGACRFAEAAEYACRYLGHTEPPSPEPGLEVIHPEFVRDHDPLILARALVPQSTALLAWASRRRDCDTAIELAGIGAEAAVRRIYGLDAEELPQAFYAASARVQGAATPTIDETVEAVAAVRSFFADHVPHNGPLIGRVAEEMRETVRWDEIELPRLGYGSPAPDLSGLADIVIPSGPLA